ncbi:tetratricopeptide repeat protein [Piscinibacter sakaiensis]|uniref:tetratricopeptide repeat protein n=1 Tax=Piscinibacter sakaiensis TaxID=1547922 RepID=UPI003AAD4514
MLLAVVLLLVACAAPPAQMPPAATLFEDRHFSPPAVRPDAGEVFRLSDAMRSYLEHDLAPLLRRRGTREGLIAALYNGDNLKLEYDAAYTRNAAEAFDARSGNCLSLVIMTAAFARALDLQVYFNRVSIDEQWRLSGNLMMAAGHVNLSLGRHRLGDRGYRIDHLLTIDFLPAVELKRQRSDPIDEDTVVGMYMNNRAAELLADERIDEAYWWAREAILKAPAEIAGYNTLAVVYLRRGLEQPAEQVLKLALQRQPDNTRLLGNLVNLLQRQGRGSEHALYAQRLRALEPIAPYRDFHLGQAALDEGRFVDALQLFGQELKRSPEQPEAHFGIARAYLALGRIELARRHLLAAREFSSSRGEAALYTAKLGRLPASRVQ